MLTNIKMCSLQNLINKNNNLSKNSKIIIKNRIAKLLIVKTSMICFKITPYKTLLKTLNKITYTKILNNKDPNLYLFHRRT